MAFSDYGAFVYRNGKRRRDRENVGVYEEGNDSPVRQRIFENIINRLAANDQEKDPNALAASYCHHAVLGDGVVRVGCLKAGIGDVFVLNENTGNIDRYNSEDIVRANLGDAFVEYDDGDYEKSISDMTKEESDVYFSRNDEYYAQFSGPYDYSFDINGAHVEFAAVIGDDPDIVVYPRYRAKLIEADGSVWHGFYDSCYGAGFTDETSGTETSAFDEIENAQPHEVNRLCVRVVDTKAYEDAPEIDVNVSGLYTPSGKVIYRGEEAYVYINDEPEIYRHSTASRDDSFISAEDYIAILNEGIALAKLGIDEVSCTSGSWGGQHEGLDEFERVDDSWEDTKIDYDGQSDIYNDFRKFHHELRALVDGRDPDVVQAMIVEQYDIAENKSYALESGEPQE